MRQSASNRGRSRSKWVSRSGSPQSRTSKFTACTSALSSFRHLRLRLLQPERMSISRYIVVAVVRCSLRLLALARAPVELAEAEVAVGDEGAHAARLGERQRLAVVGLAASRHRTGRDGSRCRRAGAAHGPRTRGDAERIRPRGRPGAAPRRAGRAADRRDPASGRPSRDGRRFPSPPERSRSCSPSRSRFSASLASPSCARTQAEEATARGSRKTTFPVRNTAIPCSISERAFAQSPLRRWSVPAARWARPTVNACCVGSASRIASASYSAASANLPSSGEAHDQPAAIVDRCRCGVPEILVDPVGGQRREVVGGQLDHPLVLAPVVVRLLEIGSW